MKNFQLTYTECKQIVEAGLDLRDSVESLNDQPEWLTEMGAIESAYELKSILEGGCASGAYMPAVTYYTANQIMAKYGDDVLDFLDNYGYDNEITINPSQDSWHGIAVKCLSMAVEMWCYQREEIAESLSW